MIRRPGLTMTELLIAIFIVAIGLAGVMSMVPFGAKQMSDALVADRTTSHANTIDGLVRGYWKEKVVDNPNSTEPFWKALDNAADMGGHPSGATMPVLDPGSSEPSYPVVLDPMGVVGRGNPNDKWIGDVQDVMGSPGTITRVPRRAMSISSSNKQLELRMWSQADGFTWDDSFDGAIPKTGAEMRELRYNALAVIQRPINRDRNSATLKIVVFSNRRHLFFPPGSEAVINGVAFNPGRTDIQLPVNTITTDVKKGMWIMDATVDQPPTVTPLIRHANFYRIVSATQDATGSNWDIELHTPVRRPFGGGAYNATVVLMPGVAAVFEPQMLTGNTN